MNKVGFNLFGKKPKTFSMEKCKKCGSGYYGGLRVESCNNSKCLLYDKDAMTKCPRCKKAKRACRC